MAKPKHTGAFRFPQDGWERPHPPREMRLADLTVDEDGRPLIGTPLGRKQIVLDGCIAREKFKMGRLVGWQGRDNQHPIIEYPDGTYEVVESLRDTNWKSI